MCASIENQCCISQKQFHWQCISQKCFKKREPPFSIDYVEKSLKMIFEEFLNSDVIVFHWGFDILKDLQNITWNTVRN